MKKDNFEQIQNELLIPLGLRMKNYRKFRRVSRSDMSKYVGVKPLQILQYENGKCDVCLSRLFKISECLKIPCSELLPEQNNVECLSNDILSLLSYIKENDISALQILDKLKKGVL